MKWFALCASVWIAGCGSCESREAAPSPAPPPPTPEELVTLSCTACHGADLVAAQHLTEAQWNAVLTKMVSWGATLDDAEKLSVAAYLTTHDEAFVPPITHDALSAIEPTDDGAFAHGDATRGRAFYTESCAPCHGADARGSAIGVNLVDRYLLYRAQDFAAIVRNGRGRMPPSTHRDDQIADALAWLRTLRAQ